MISCDHGVAEPDVTAEGNTLLALRPFQWEQLAIVEPWFADAETQRWLGGPGWPRLMLELGTRPLGEFRRAVETGRYGWLAWDGGEAVGYIDCGTTDRWTTWDGKRVVATIPVPAANISYVVNPSCRRRGYGKAMVAALLAEEKLAHIELWAAGVEPANVASTRLLRAAGFTPLGPMADFEGIVYWARRR